jgi:hypothetical protein
MTAIIPVIKALITRGTEIPTVKSHQWPSSNVTRPSNINAKKTVSNSKKKIFNAKDHLPNIVLGNKVTLIFIIN